MVTCSFVFLLIYVFCIYSNNACLPGEYQCGDGICINVLHVCDGYNDCETNDDELNCNEIFPLMIISTKHKITEMNMKAQDTHTFLNTSPTLSSAFAVDTTEGRIYATVFLNMQSLIYSCRLRGTDVRPFITAGLRKPEDLALDSLGRNLYIVDTGLNQIIICDLRASLCRNFGDANKHRPRSVALYPAKRLMYWANWSNRSAIYEQGMDGSNLRVLVNDTLRPGGLTIDRMSKTLFWCGNNGHSIESVNLDGAGRKVIYEKQSSIFTSLAAYEGNIYWTDALKKCVDSGNQKTVKAVTSILKESEPIINVYIYNPMVQKTESESDNPCSDSSCSHICLLSPVNGYVCECPVGLTLASDRKNCLLNKMSPTLYVVEGNSVYHINPDAVGKDLVVQLPFSGVTEIGDIAWDWARGVFYITETSKQLIMAFNFTSVRERSKMIIKDQLAKVESLDYDWIGLNVYWTDGSKQTIEVARYDGEYRTILVQGMARVSDLLLSPEQGIMYVAILFDVAEIGVFDMDGSNYRSLVSNDVTTPISLALDFRKEKLYWADARLGCIEAVELESQFSSGEIMRNNLGQVISVAVGKNYYYWTDTNHHGVFYSDHLNTVLGNYTLPGINRKKFPRVVHVYPQTLQSEACYGNGVKCSHLCLLTSSSYTCACPESYFLSSDRHTCQDINTPTPCRIEEILCDDNSCVAVNKKCDEKPSCIDSSSDLSCHTERVPIVTNTDEATATQNIITNEDQEDPCFFNNSGCSHICTVSTDGRAKCSCRQGYVLEEDGKACKDEDECVVNKCAHYCINTEGGFKCSCATGYRRGANRTCHPKGDPPYLLMLLKNQVKVLDLGSRRLTQIHESPTGDFIGMDFDVDQEIIYWTDLYDGNLSGYFFKEKRVRTVKSLENTRQIAYDWIGKNLYYVTQKTKINACGNGFKYCTVVINDWRIVNELALAPNLGTMFWSNWKYPLQPNTGKIFKCHMDGSNQVEIIEDSEAALSLTVDHIQNKLYWADVLRHQVLSCDYNGSERHVIANKEIVFPFSLALYEDNIYWSEWTNSTIYSTNKFKETSRKIVAKGIHAVTLTVMQNVRQPKVLGLIKQCDCDHICLLQPNGVACRCSEGYTMSSEGSCVSNEDNFRLPEETTKPTRACNKKCLNGGECVNFGEEFCRCKPTFYGDSCEKYIVVAKVNKSYDYSFIVISVLGVLFIILIAEVLYLCYDSYREKRKRIPQFHLSPVNNSTPQRSAPRNGSRRATKGILNPFYSALTERRRYRRTDCN